MLPAISIVDSVEMIRDGGSLAAAFRSPDGSEYWLFYKVRLKELPTGETERLGYASPVIVDRMTGSEIELSWQHAKIFLHQMRPLLRGHSGQEWFDLMEATADASGQLPSGMGRFFG